MLKKIGARKKAETLRPGDVIFDNPNEEKAREFKIKIMILDYVLALLGGDFPSLKIIRKKNLSSGNWWIRVQDPV